MRGWVYIVTNKSMPGLLKVGFTSKDPQSRAVDLGHTGSPHPYKVLYDVLVHDPASVEKRAHRKLNRVREGKEWFCCSVELAVEAIRSAAGPKLLLESGTWTDETSTTFDPNRGRQKSKCAVLACKRRGASEVRGIVYCKEHAPANFGS